MSISALPNDYDADPSRFLATEQHPHDDVHPYVAERFAAAGARSVLDVGGGNGKLARLRVYRLSETAATGAAARLDLPLTLTKRGCIVYATKGAA